VRGQLLWAAGLRDLRDVPSGQGNTGRANALHSFQPASSMPSKIPTQYTRVCDVVDDLASSIPP
jgi:hypothetical protein